MLSVFFFRRFSTALITVIVWSSCGILFICLMTLSMLPSDDEELESIGILIDYLFLRSLLSTSLSSLNYLLIDLLEANISSFIYLDFYS